MPTLSLTQISTPKPVLGEFGKGMPGAATLNFCASGTGYCSHVCRFHPASISPFKVGLDKACYSVRIELRPDREELRSKLLRHSSLDPQLLVERAIREVKERLEHHRKLLEQAVNADDRPLIEVLEHEKAIPWFRFCSAGSVPPPAYATNGYIRALRRLLDVLNKHDIPVHFPVEAEFKRAFYQKAIKDRATVRLSCQSIDEFLNCQHPCSVVVGDYGEYRRSRVAQADALAKLKRIKSGKRCIVCPAVAARYRNNNQPVAKCKCGYCTCCADPNVSIIYCLH